MKWFKELKNAVEYAKKKRSYKIKVRPHKMADGGLVYETHRVWVRTSSKYPVLERRVNRLEKRAKRMEIKIRRLLKIR